MEGFILILLIVAALLVLGPFIVPFFLPNLKGFDGCSSILIGLLFVALLGWWGVVLYIVLIYIGKNIPNQS